MKKKISFLSKICYTLSFQGIAFSLLLTAEILLVSEIYAHSTNIYYTDTLPKKMLKPVTPEKQIEKPESHTVCSKPVHTWFNKMRKTAWPDANGAYAGNVKIGYFHYTESEGRAIGYSPEPYGRYDAKHAFMVLVTLRLSFVPETAPVWKNAKVVEDWILTLGKISPSNLPPAPDPKMPNYVKLVDAWIKGNLCN